ncbi:3'-5' exonuclease [Seleniivibrio woodruffii]|uniref:3'-5' exonuclease n=1 Tax=Seleniivibrio woodruffii TaxID=1078050 RepID=UPI00240A385D|nr:3'-5' exonuclease [Seleniivibrio woodruffii]
MYNTPFTEMSFTVFDTETTGMSPARGARLVEIAAVRVKPGLVVDLQDTFSSLINPKTDIPYQAYAIHGINTRMVADKPEAYQVLPQFLEFTGNSIVAAHNAGFDYSFLTHHLEEKGLSTGLRCIIDTVKLSRAAEKGLKSYSLDNLIHHFDMKIPLPDSYRHRALFDAAHTALLLCICLKKLANEDICTPAQLFTRYRQTFHIFR